LPGKTGQASPQPMVITTSAARTTSSVQGLGYSAEMSMPRSFIAAMAAGLTCSPGSDPPDQATARRALPVRTPITGLDRLGPADGVYILHSMGDTFALTHTIDTLTPRTALIVGAGYVGLEMAEGLTARGLHVTQVEMLPEVLSTVDPGLGGLVHAELARHGVQMHTRSTVTAITRTPDGPARLHVQGSGPDKAPQGWDVDLVLVVVGVRPYTDLLVEAGARTGPRGAVLVDETMATGLPHVWAAGDCIATHHQLLGVTYLPLGTTAHKQGRIAGENALGGTAHFAGSLGTQAVKVFDLVAARTGLREHEATAAGYTPVTTQSAPDDHKAYYPGASPITIRITGEQVGGLAIRDHDPAPLTSDATGWLRAIALTPLPRRVPGLVRQRRRAAAAAAVRQSGHTISQRTSASIREAR
jgi:pyridine nucleotide-disulfide oxidoreductase